MGILINKSDFTGIYELNISIKDKIDDYIEEYEESILRQLLGSDLFVLFQSDLTNQVPVDPIYLKLYEPNEDLCTKGMKKMLLGFIYYEYVRDSPRSQGMNGPIKRVTEVSEPASLDYLPRMYNKSVNTYYSIQRIASNDNTNYPDYAGQYIKKTSLF